MFIIAENGNQESARSNVITKFLSYNNIKLFVLQI